MRTELYDYLVADETIADLVVDRIHWDYAPANPVYPYILLSVISETPDPTLTVSSGYREITIQADCISSTSDNEADKARAIADAVEARLDGAQITGTTMVTTPLSLSRIEVTNWDGKGQPPLEGWSIEIRIDRD